MAGFSPRWMTGALLCALALAVSSDRPDRPASQDAQDPAVTPEMRAAAAELLAARRENVRRQRAGEPAGWMR